MSTLSAKHIGVIGLGIIGSRVAANVAKAGHEVFVWSRSPHAVPNFLSSPREVAESATILQIFVRDDAALIAAMNDMKPALTPRHIVMNHATVSPDATLQAAKIASEQGAGFLDAPFTGSKMAAQNGKIVYYIGGDEGLLDQVRDVLSASGTQIMHVGKIGDATVLKIATNAITAVTVKGIEEALAITRAQGIAPEKLLESLQPNANFSPLVGMKLPAMIHQDFEAHFSLRNMLKDADFARTLAAKAKLSVPALDAMASAMRAQLDAGNGDKDFSVIGLQ
jgi:3-hydroxyisobutyrate dehydrogenase-like beta-hydroxyacid dehydrogenase